MFTKAERKKSKLRLALSGPSGSGKTWGALKIAQGIGGKIAVIDTEKGSAAIYSDWADFDVMELPPPYTPEAFIDAMNEAANGDYSILVIDSITHEWSGVGGCLELQEEIAKAKYRGNSWSAWNEMTPRHRAFLDAIQQSPLHVIATMRSKTETAQTEEGGRKKVVKLGMKSEQRDGIEYEFTTFLDIVHDGHYAVASKDRTGLFSDKKPIVIGKDTGELLKDWLDTGEDSKNNIINIDFSPVYWVELIDNSIDMNDLKINYTNAVKAARKAKNKDAENDFSDRKENRKKFLDEIKNNSQKAENFSDVPF